MLESPVGGDEYMTLTCSVFSLPVADESQAAGYKQRAHYSLKTPGNNKLPNVERESAPDRGYAEEY